MRLMNNKIKKMVLSALLAALCCVATMIIKIPTPFKGYLNLGDAFVMLSGWVLPPLYGFLAAGIGSAMADAFSGFMVYIPATFIIKGLMALSCHIISGKKEKILFNILGGISAVIILVLGYFIYEWILYGVGTALADAPFNAAQGAVGLILSLPVKKIFDKSKIGENI